MKNRNNQLKSLRLPAVRAGMPVRTSDIRDIQNVITTLQKICSLNVSRFEIVKAGDALTADLMNKIFKSIVDLNIKVEIKAGWECFPVKRGIPATEKMFNELIGSINLIIFKLQNKDIDLREYVELHELKNRLSDQQIEIINIAWEYYSENDECIPSRVLFSKIDQPKAKEIVQDIGGAFIFETSENGEACYQVTFLGVTLTNYYIEIEDLLVKYFEFIRSKYVECPNCKSISHEEVNQKLDIGNVQSTLLRRVINLGHFFHGSMGYSDSGYWEAGFPEDVEELRFVDDLRSYIVGHALKYARLSDPVNQNERYKLLESKIGNHGVFDNVTSANDVKPEPPKLISNLLWLKHNWKKYWGYLLVGFIIVIIGRIVI